MRQYRLERAPRRAPEFVVSEWTIEVDTEGSALLCGDEAPLFAADRLARLLETLGLDERDLVEVPSPG